MRAGPPIEPIPSPALQKSIFSPDRRQNLFWIALLIAFGFLLYSLAVVLTPFLFGAILAYMLNPGVNGLTRHRCPRWLATLSMIFLLIVAAIILLLTIVPVLQGELMQLQQKFPELLIRLNESVAPRLRNWFGIQVQFSNYSIRKLITEQWGTQDLLTSLVASLRVGGRALLNLVGNALLVPVVLFYLLLDWDLLLRKLDDMIPRRVHPRFVMIVHEINALLAQFLRGQVLLMLILAVYYSTALTVAGFDVALPVGILTGLLVFVPYIGFALGLILAILAGFLQFNGWYGLIAVAVIYGAGQLAESAFLTPRLVGERIGLHPLAVIFALLAFGEVFGFFGVLLALPASAALLVGLRHLKVHYLASNFYDSSEKIAIER